MHFFFNAAPAKLVRRFLVQCLNNIVNEVNVTKAWIAEMDQAEKMDIWNYKEKRDCTRVDE